jgi:hypothetical protein
MMGTLLKPWVLGGLTDAIAIFQNIFNVFSRLKAYLNYPISEAFRKISYVELNLSTGSQQENRL